MPRDFGIDDEDLVKAAKEALERPSDFGYYGDLPLFESWGMTYVKTRDSDVLERSNFRRLLEDAQGFATALDGDNGEDASEYVQVISCSHWAYGYADHIVVKVLEDPEGDIVPENITQTFKFMADACLRLRDEYPVYDESDYSELETEECEAAFDSEWDGVDWEEITPEEPDSDIKWCVYRKLTENETPDGFDRDEIRAEYLAVIEFQAWQEYDRGNPDQYQLFSLDWTTSRVYYPRGCPTCGNQWQH